MSRTNKDTPKAKSARRHRCTCTGCQRNRRHAAIRQAEAAVITADDYVAMMRQWAADDDEALAESDKRRWKGRG